MLKFWVTVFLILLIIGMYWIKRVDWERPEDLDRLDEGVFCVGFSIVIVFGMIMYYIGKYYSQFFD